MSRAAGGAERRPVLAVHGGPAGCGAPALPGLVFGRDPFDGRLGVLDFGKVGRLRDGLREAFVDFLAAVFSDDGGRLTELYLLLPLMMAAALLGRRHGVVAVTGAVTLVGAPGTASAWTAISTQAVPSAC